MKIGIDASALVKQKTGIEQWLSNFLYHLMQIDCTNQYFLFSYDEPSLSYPLNDNFKIVYYGGKSKKRSLFFTQLPKALKRCQIDLFLGAKPYLPPFHKNKIKYLAVVHDLLPLYMPELFTFSHRLRFKILTSLCRHQAHELIAVSNATKQDIIKYMRFPSARIHVVYEGADSEFNTKRAPALIDQTMQKYKIDAPYILCLSTVEPRKNMLRTIKAYEAYMQETPVSCKLVIVGGSGWNNGEIYDYVNQNSDLKSHVIFTGYVSDQEVKHIYANATLFIYASLCEGFGLPILEAMQSGIPVITSNVSSMPEVAGDACYLVNPLETEEIKQAIKALMSSPQKREELTKKGLERARKFSWEKCAKEIYEIMNNLLNS